MAVPPRRAWAGTWETEGGIVNEIQKRAAEALRKFSLAMQKFAEAGRKGGEAGQKFADQIQHWNFLSTSRLPELLAYSFTATDGAVCEASRLRLAPSRHCWPATHN
jgi:hypothetical protein